MTRWRIQVARPDNPKRAVVRVVAKDCRLCVIARAMTMARHLDDALRLPRGSFWWQVERPDGHLNGWEIVFTDRSRIGDWVLSHGH